MSPGIKLLGVTFLWLHFGPAGSIAHDHPAIEVRADETSSCAVPLVPAQAGGDEERGCCILVTESGPRCAYTNRGYCTMRAAEAGLRFEFHTVASCSDLPQCR
jgi:hypothetical protein